MVKVFSTASNPRQTNLFHFKVKESSLTQKLNAFIEKRYKETNFKPVKVFDYQHQTPRHVHIKMTLQIQISHRKKLVTMDSSPYLLAPATPLVKR